MNEKNNNVFRFSLYQEKVLLGEKIFDADQFNPFTRYSIDIRDILPRAITKLQKTLSKRNYDFRSVFDVVNTNASTKENDLYQYHQAMIDAYPEEYRESMEYNPQPIVQQIEEKTIKGVECKIGFYINDKPIVERLFYVDGFNLIARWSYELTHNVIVIANDIFNQIKRNDVKNMWDDYDLINIKGLSITQIRELSPSKREEMLRRIRKN